ncbi:hypothetical protein SAMN05660659_01770 [Pseudomonas sp. LAMO17WK12:I6]|jgi:hypothetical protein|uniref:hypothetical protein n=1 Tax=unclassified Pseudomonas TaxID=196821 RepID=UPI000BCFD259|nr:MULTISPECIES: hypothetical protein [unclassified Pseudomonas]SNY18848.1 hypothetical protein SAMN05660659_01770 [Pseudomonas sp. LAMO17WK12:I6]SNY22260.1 hypothetical protein SAMN05660455_02263 [Pseudomonas sp. LAMO17WK12:I5]
MRKLQRPPVAPDFDSRASTIRARVASAATQGAKPEFSSLWSDYKDVFSEAQGGRCGYCEGQVWGLHYGDVEHIQPKAEIHTLEDQPEDWGREVPWKGSVIGRKNRGDVIMPGYWWRAYSWDNYLLSCQVCNQQWKANFYPVKGEHTVVPTSAAGRPLLLSPFDEHFKPEEHFSFGRLGEISALTEEGRATISTCGLDRPSLRLARYKIAHATHEHLDEIARNVTERDVLRVLECVAMAGHATTLYCGMVRVIFTQRTTLEWDTLSTLISGLRESANADRSLCDC